MKIFILLALIFIILGINAIFVIIKADFNLKYECKEVGVEIDFKYEGPTCGNHGFILRNN